MGQLHYTATPATCNVNYKIKTATGGAYELYEVNGLDIDYHLYIKPEIEGETVVKYGDNATFKIDTTEDDSLESISTKLKRICFIAKGLGEESDATIDSVQSLDDTTIGSFNRKDATLIL